MQLKLLCPTSAIGAVIGKQGATVKEVRESTNAKIHIGDPVHGVQRCDERVITIAPSAARAQASPKNAAHDVELALFQVLNHIWDGTQPAEDNQVIARLLVESAGCLIGKAGAVIQQMRADSGASIQIMSGGKSMRADNLKMRFDHIPLCALPGEMVVHVQAIKPNLIKALQMVVARLLEETLARGSRDAPKGVVGVARGSQLAPSVYEPMGMMPLHFVPHVPPIYALPNGRSVGGPREGGAEVTFRMLVSNNKAGLLIGKGGCVISHLRQTLPGVKINILDAVGDCDERIVVVSSVESVHECLAQFAVSQIQMLLYSPDEDAAVTRLLLPQPQIGAFLGKKGANIQDIRHQSNAQVKLHTEGLPACALPDDALLEVASPNFKHAQVALNMATQRLRIAFSQSLQRGSAGAE